ncbi:unnamed protein product [Rhizophagus irregularis]|nr:unnamed protein product [Rhizophagus irregularis]
MHLENASNDKTSESTSSKTPRRFNSVKKYKYYQINTFLIQLKKNISNSTTFCKAVTCLELLVFLYCAIEWSLKIASIPIPNLGSEESYNYDLHYSYHWGFHISSISSHIAIYTVL